MSSSRVKMNGFLITSAAIVLMGGCVMTPPTDMPDAVHETLGDIALPGDTAPPGDDALPADSAPLPPDVSPPAPVTPPAGAPPVPGGATSEFVSGAASIVARAGGPRTDKENVAPPIAQSTLLSWRDSRGRERTMTLGAYLYQYDFTFSDGVNEVVRSANDDAWGHEGFGYVVSHNTQNGNSPLGKANAPTKIETTIFDGGHHAIYRVEMLYDRDKEAGGNGIKIPVVIEWMVATGRDHPIWAVNWKTGEALNPNNVNFDADRMDCRGPYGSLNFDGAATRNAGDAIGTIAWGDFGRRFATTDAMLTMQSPWTYDAANRVPFVAATTFAVNAEMGIVRTLADDKEMGYSDRVVGRERGATSAVAFTNRGDCNAFLDARAYTMPCVNGWPYQMMNFDWGVGSGKPLNEATGTKLLAWGTNYGWLGASSFNLFDYSATASGRGDRSYATLIVLGPKGRAAAAGQPLDQPGDVALALRQVESLADATISNVTLGSVAAEAPRGPLSTQMRPLDNGYNDTYATHHLRAATEGVAFTFTPGAAAAIRNPVFVIESFTSAKLPKVSVDGVVVAVNSDGNAGAFASLDAANQRLWLTLNRTVGAPVAIRVGP
ncbi:MAG: hypothetical protein SF069_05720 [Phycisphaerae bacterium]|nr:hypothetical protein [Phycisphaerae bacterium]